MKKTKGASLAQYAIVLAVLSVSLIAVYGFLGQQINSILTSYLGIFTSNNAKVQANAALLTQKGGSLSYTVNTIPAGSMGGTPDVPVQACASGSCTIDFGSYILSGVPENFSEVVKNNGTSGGLDKIVDLMMQIADQIEQKGDITGAQQFRDMANLGHFMANIHKTRETVAKECEETTSALSCYHYNTVAKKVTVPENINFLKLKEYSSNSTFDIGHARYAKSDTTVPGQKYFYNSLLNTSPPYNFVELYDNIQANASFSDEIKGISTELYLIINDLQKHADSTHETLNNGISEYGFSVVTYDPLTGEIISNEYSPTKYGNTMSSLYSPNFGNGQHFNSSLVCSAGKNVDVQNKCHK